MKEYKLENIKITNKKELLEKIFNKYAGNFVDFFAILDDAFIYHTSAGFLEYDLKEFVNEHPETDFGQFSGFQKILFDDIIKKIDVNYKNLISLTHEEFLCFVTWIFLQTSPAIEIYFKQLKGI